MGEGLLVSGITVIVLALVFIQITTQLHEVTTEPCTPSVYGCLDAYEVGGDWKYKNDVFNENMPEIYDTTVNGAVLLAIAELAMVAMMLMLMLRAR